MPASTMNDQLVTIIVVSYNHAPYLREALESVFRQTYPHIEVIVVDDASQDHSTDIINEFEKQGYKFEKLLLQENHGYCKAFNLGLAKSKGDFIIDLSGDDVLMDRRVECGIAGFRASGAAVDFCDVYYIDQSSKILSTHFKRDSRHHLLEQVAQGDIFKNVLERYFICAPGMMISRKVLDTLGGYDESLYYEDFDFWVRSSRKFNYHFTNRVLVKKRVVSDSMSKSQYKPDSKMLPSTLEVCRKAFDMCNSEEEFRALAKRIRYELRQSVLSNNYQVARELHYLLEKTEPGSIWVRFWNWGLAREWDLSFMTRFMGKSL